jgi:4-hydroxybenzoate polyprenyltransferase
VLGSDGATNLTGNKKLNELRSRLGDGPFDYIGNDTPDLPLLAQAAVAMVANPSLSLRRKMRSSSLKPARVFQERRHPVQSALKCIRPHKWAKNLLLFLPLFLSHDVTAAHLLAALVAFCCLSLAASATYVINDLLDIEADRHHPRKRFRPFASGDLSAFSGLCIVAVFLALAFAGARMLPAAFFLWLLVYIAATLSYSLYLKRVALVDVLVLSGLYTLRLLIGGAATNTLISHWLAGFAIFLFLSLAIVKRFAELENLRASGGSVKNGRGYLVADMEQIRAFGTASAFASVVVFANYISGQNVIALYRHPAMLWLIVPLMILWLCRVWLLASRGELSEDPVVFALTDRMSLLIGGAVGVITVLAV